MEYITLWLGTIVISICMDVANDMKIFKDLADAGYKFDLSNLSEVKTRIGVLPMLIPIYNILINFKNTMQYNNSRFMLLDELRIKDILVEMSDYEKQEYLKKPTGFNAMIVPIKAEEKLKCAPSIVIEDNNGTSEIYFELGNSLDDINILKVNGAVVRMSNDEQKQLVKDSCVSLYEDGIKKYGNDENFIDALDDVKDSVVILDDKEDIQDQNVINDDKREKLNNLRNELLDEKQRLSSNSSNNNLSLKKIKRD
jgi:hypothetical protein